VKQRSKQWVSHGVTQKGAHRERTAQKGTQGSTQGRTGGAQWAHREPHSPRFPNFFAFQAREMKFDEQIWWHMVISNSPWHTVISNSLWHTVISKTERLIFVDCHDRGVMQIDEKQSA
jgi:hypothetical protein